VVLVGEGVVIVGTFPVGRGLVQGGTRLRAGSFFSFSQTAAPANETFGLSSTFKPFLLISK
jgi:hypothetical protein